jgi:hypothetical protein
MPPTQGNPNKYFLRMIQDLQTQITKLGQQGSFATTSKLAGGGPALVVGNNPNDPVTPTDVHPNMTVTDGTGAVRAVAGQLNDTDYGFQVQDPSGVKQQLWPVSSGLYSVGALSTTSETYTPLDDYIAVTVWIGSSGDALVTVSAIIGLDVVTGTTQGVVGLSVDGVTPVNAVVSASCTAETDAVGIQNTGTNTVRLSQWSGALTPNMPHIFTLQYASIFGQTTNFSGISLIVQPI